MTKTKIKNRIKNKKLLGLAFIPLIALIILGLNINTIGPILDFNSITTKEGKAGDAITLESKKGEFMVDVGNQRYYSKNEKGNNTLTLPNNNQEGNYEYKVSSYVKLGFTQLRFNDKKVTIFKDYQPPIIQSVFPKLVQSKDFEVSFKSDPKPFILTII